MVQYFQFVPEPSVTNDLSSPKVTEKNFLVFVANSSMAEAQMGGQEGCLGQK